ncbi:MAG TPA: mechanosensitive ion channel [Arcobacter sp.]|nr:mechanosensitive ion channel [Arcobacter sp.]
MLKIVFLFLFLISNIFANEENILQKAPEELKKAEIEKLKSELEAIDLSLEANIWITRYNNYLTYRKLESELEQLSIDFKKYSTWKSKKYKELSYQLQNKIKIKQNELSLIDEYKDSPIGALIKPKVIETKPNITNPFNIVEAFSYIQNLESSVKNYKNTGIELTSLLKILSDKTKLYKKINELANTNGFTTELAEINQELKDFSMVLDIVSTTSEVYAKKVDQIKQEVQDDVANEIERTIKLALLIILLIALSIIVKVLLKKYITEDDNHYTSNKLVNFILILFIVFILIFSYIDNASYLVTVLGFASAGIAIALKDWFMSIFGWFAIMTNGSIRVGDRIKVTRDGTEVVGDVLDISLFKIAVREDVTLTTYMRTRRSGRVFFVPNSYIFTDLISNYTYDGLRTVWDGVDVMITFDSNHAKAIELCTEIATRNARGFTELTKKRLNKLKTKYVLRSTNPEPRVFAFAETYGIVVTTWFYTNSYGTLPLRTKISLEIVDAFNAADDITIAYPTQTVRGDATTPRVPPFDTSIEGGE